MWTAKTSHRCCGGLAGYPRDKALEIARKICAGLAAAHDKGVLHRDLKPSNIMLDWRGEVLIMDFGLAGLAHEIEDVRSGTPVYMAPEQLAGKEVTARSDIYALGLVLYELFTGKPAFEGKTHDEIMRVRRESTPHRPSTLVSDLDPAVELVIMRCLEEEPEHRPSSALIVSAALPGGEYLIAIYLPGRLRPFARNRSDVPRHRRAQRRNGGCRCQSFRGRPFVVPTAPGRCGCRRRWQVARHQRPVRGAQGTHHAVFGC